MTLARLLSESIAGSSLPSTGDVLAVGLPFLRQLDRLHHEGMVMRPYSDRAGTGLAGLDYDGHHLRFDEELVQRPADNLATVNRINPIERGTGIEVAARFEVDHGAGRYHAVTSGDVFDAESGSPERPSFLVGYRAWEQLHGHHDVLTDITVAGLVLTSYATGLDLDLSPAVHQLALQHRHLVELNRHLHPVVAGVLSDMIRPDRHERPTDLGAVLARLEHHRDLPADLDLAAAYGAEQRARPGGWRSAVLSTLRERVFDLSRRNREIYFRPSSSTLSLTEASVPLMLNVERIQPDDLLTWTGSSAAAFRKGKPVDLAKWCRFEEAPHIVPSLDKLISAERKFRAEHGQGRLRLIIAFLRWVDPESGETVNSPLLSMPARLVKKKGVQDRYTVEVNGEADVNPSLRFLLRSRFGIVLSERIEADPASIERLVDQLRGGIQSTDPSVEVELVDKPRINLIKRRAQLRVDAYRRRRAQARASSGRWRRQEHSYDLDDWRPLGLALYRRFVEPSELPLRALTAAPPYLRRSSSFAAPTSGLREKENYAVLSGDVSRQRWEVDLCAVTLALVGSRRTTLARDYDALIEQASSTGAGARPTMPDAPFNLLFSPDPPIDPAGPVPSISLDQLLVLPADDAQTRAVRRGVRGDSFIIQGPPGTGKSQTITNLIAALVAENKRVLFVCEKRAALDVVAHRLQQVGLAELVATIHDSQLDRKAFIKDLGATYERWSAAPPDDRQARRGEALAAVEALLRPIEVAFEEIQRSGGGRDEESARHSPPSLVQLIERLVLLRSAGVVAAPTDSLPPGLRIGDWLAARPQFDAVAGELASSGLSSRLGGHGAFRLHPSSFGSSDPLGVVRSVGRSISTLAEALAPLVGSAFDIDEVGLAALRTIADHRNGLVSLQRSGTLGVLDRTSAMHAEMVTADERLAQWDVARHNAAHGFAGWRQVPSADDARNGLAIAVAKESSTFRFLDGRWRSVRRLVEDGYDVDRHQIRPSITQILTELVAAFDASDGFEAQRAYVRARFGTDDPNKLLGLVADLAAEPVALRLASAGVDLAAVAEAAAQLLPDTHRLLLDHGSATVADVRAASDQLAQVGVAHERALVEWATLGEVPWPVLLAAVSGSGLDEVELAAIEAELHAVAGRLSGMTSAQLEGSLDKLLALYRTLLSTNAGFVASRVEERFRENLAFAESSMAGRSDADKERKKRYNAGRRVLEREFQKKMRHRSIRELASGDSGLVLRDLKPVWLMSPLSVSDTLPLDEDLFDVVIFDEASQIPVEDAVPTLHRGRQAVVVGDRMQLPPTRFFAADADDDDDDEGIVVDSEGHRLTITLDADSFLTQADISLESALLSWHYRSRHESLIAYSNNAFYEGLLSTIPDRRFVEAARGAITASSAEDAAANLASMLDRPISFHKITHGVYRDRRNDAEAEYIAELVRTLLRRQDAPGAERLTIGIVAFSEAQQKAIEGALEELASIDPAFAALLEAEEVRTDDGEFVGLFVKNLENVQGDERDLIIMSVCYGPGPGGAMKMNFGPINQAGGERRLNVIFSRSKRHMAIVSSIEGGQITNTHNDGASNLARFLDYAAAESSGADEVSTALLDGLRPDIRTSAEQDAAARSAVAAEIAAHLRNRGWDVDLDVGRSVFTVDAAVRGTDGYRLGVLIDPGDGATAARMIAEGGVLEAFGWPIARVLITEWWSDPVTVIDRLDHRLRRDP